MIHMTDIIDVRRTLFAQLVVNPICTINFVAYANLRLKNNRQKTIT